MRQIAPIQRLRALAALMVVVGHTQTEAIVAAAKAGLAFTPVALLPWGAGVDLFFVISGFIMVVASERLFAHPDGAKTFAARRLKRIVPLYWLFTTLYVAIQFVTHKPVGGLDLLSSYLFWPRDIFGDGVIRPIFTLGWTLNYEMFFYALFAVAIRWPAQRAVAAIALLLATGVVIGRMWPLAPGPLAFWTQPIVLEFVLGMAIALAWRHGVRLPSAMRVALFATALLLLAYDVEGSARQSSHWTTPTDLVRLLGWGVPAAVLVAAAVLGTARPAAVRSLPLDVVALGDSSYALYLVHPFVVGTFMRIWTSAGLAGHLGYWPFVGVSLAVSIAVAVLLHRFFELPVARFLALRRLDGKPVGDGPVAGAPLVRSGS